MSNSLVNFIYDENSGAFTVLPASIVSRPSGINHQGQLTGGIGSIAYLATPQ